MSDPLISIVMPALNEEKNLAQAVKNTLDAFDEFGVAGEIIVVNDGSTDGTGDVIDEAMNADTRVSVIQHLSPQGVGASFWDGVGQAQGEFVCMLPGDNENDPLEIMRYHRLLEQVDILVPFVFNKQARSLFRNALSFLYRFIINTTFMVYFNYTNGTVMYRKKLLEQLEIHSSGFFFQTDILVRLVKRGYLFAEVPYWLNQRPHGVSKAVSFPSLKQVIGGYIRLVRDIYFPPKKQPDHVLAADSLTAQRYEEHDSLVMS